MLTARSEKIDRLHMLYRTQSGGVALARRKQVASLLAWLRVERERLETAEDHRIVPTPAWLRERISDQKAIRSAQRDLISLLIYLTTPIVNGESPTQIYAKLENGRNYHGWRRQREARRAMQEAIDAAKLADETERAAFTATLREQAAALSADSVMQVDPDSPLAAGLGKTAAQPQ